MSKDIAPVIPPAAERRLTAPAWSPQLCRALDQAEVAVAGFYAIRPREWISRFRYDVASAADHPGLAFPLGTLAQIVELRFDAGPRPSRWRIVLRDPLIFRMGRRLGLRTVLAYTFAHELVHLVRFASGIAPFDLGEEHRRTEEESRVRRIARDALLPVLGPGSRPALDRLAGT
jgi:hypothetical protein